jgi:hypothetical protein
MTEPQSADEPQRVAELDFFAQLKADTEKFERRLKRQSVVARWFMIPYAASGAMIGIGIGRASDEGALFSTVAMLSVGFVVVVLSQWAVPYMMQNLRKGEQ